MMPASSSPPAPFAFLTLPKQKALIISLRIVSALSIVGALYIVCSILGRDRQTKLKTLFYRLLLCLSSADLIYSFAFFLATWPIPKDSIHSNVIWGNVGNQTTCNIQGFLLQLSGMGSTIYTCNFSLYFLLVIRYRWQAANFKKLEPFLHLVAVSIPLALAILFLVKGCYNPTLMTCFVQSYPIGCNNSSDVPCIRGGDMVLAPTLALAGPPMMGFTFVSASMILLYVTVRNQERRASRYSRRWGVDHKEHTRQVFVQACKYIGVAFVTLLPLVTFSIVMLCGKVNFPVLMLSMTLSPLQGFLDAIVYANIAGQKKPSAQATSSSRGKSATTCSTNHKWPKPRASDVFAEIVDLNMDDDADADENVAETSMSTNNGNDDSHTMPVSTPNCT